MENDLCIILVVIDQEIMLRFMASRAKDGVCLLSIGVATAIRCQHI
jgi:hypothetical protein